MSTFLLQLTALLLSRPSVPRPQFRSFSLPFRTQSEANLSRASRMPLDVYSRETLDAGALLSYGPSNYRIFRASGGYIHKILKGAKPADLPVEQPTKFEFIINLKTAKSIGIDVPPMLLTRADEVIE